MDKIKGEDDGREEIDHKKDAVRNDKTIKSRVVSFIKEAGRRETLILFIDFVKITVTV